MKRFLVNLFVALFLLTMIVSPSLAAKTSPPPEISNCSIGIQSLDLLAPSGTAIAKVGNGQVALVGDTFTQFTVDTIGLKLYLQKWDGSSWVDVDSSPTYEKNNADHINNVYVCSVESGYYYRTKGLHIARDGNIYETGESFSGHTYVD